MPQHAMGAECLMDPSMLLPCTIIYAALMDHHMLLPCTNIYATLSCTIVYAALMHHASGRDGRALCLN